MDEREELIMLRRLAELEAKASGGTSGSLVEGGNINLNTRPKVKNGDQYSTVRSMSIGTDRGEVLIPTVSDDGRLLSNDDAIKEYKRTGRHLGIFRDSDSATAYAKQLHLDQEKQYGEQPQGPSTGESFARGVKDPGAGLLQLLGKGAEGAQRVQEKIFSLGGLLDNPVSRLYGKAAGVSGDINREFNTSLQRDEEDYQQRRQAAEPQTLSGLINGTRPEPGTDWARIGGNVVSPVSWYLPMKAAPIAAGAPASVIAQQAGKAGGIAGSLAPIYEPTDNYAGQKAGQVATGAVVGAVTGPVLNSIANKVSEITGRLTGTRNVDPVALENEIRILLARDGIDVAQLPAGILKSSAKQAADALKRGEKLDPAAIARQIEFERIGVQPTLGQITRDPTQYTRERNLRGVEGAGEALAQRFNQQNTALGQRIGALGADKASDQYSAGLSLIERLAAADKPVKAAVSQAYGSARDSTGRHANIDVPAFSNAANNALDEKQLGRFLPESVRGLLNDVSGGKVPLNVNTAVQIDSVLSQAQRAAQRSGDDAGSLAIGAVRDALNNAPIESGAGVQAKAAFDTARGMARERFKTIEQTPALRAALDQEAPDKFVQKYIINGKVGELNALRGLIQNDPESTQIVRSQIMEHLRNKALGANTAGDKPFSQEAYNRVLRDIGTNKLLTFFSPDEVSQLQTIGRVAAYMNSQPAGSAVNNSNTAAAVMNLFAKLGNVPYIREVGAKPLENYAANRFARNALAARLAPEALLPMRSPDVDRLLPLLIPAGAAGVGTAAAR